MSSPPQPSVQQVGSVYLTDPIISYRGTDVRVKQNDYTRFSCLSICKLYSTPCPPRSSPTTLDAQPDSSVWTSIEAGPGPVRVLPRADLLDRGDWTVASTVCNAL